MSSLGQMSCFNPQPRTSSAAARTPASGRTRSPSFNPQPRTSSAAAERAKTCMTRMEFQPTAENVLGCCPGSRVRACPDWDRFNPQPRTSSAAARPRGSCRPDLRVSTHSRERPRLLPVARRATTSGSTFQPTAENVLGCCPACQPSARSRSRCFSTHSPRTSSAAARRHPRQIDAPHHVSTHSRERPRLLPPGNSQGPRNPHVQPTAENVLGCCPPPPCNPSRSNPFQPTAENVLGCCLAMSMGVSGARKFQPTAENVLGCCEGHRCRRRERAHHVSTHSRERPRLPAFRQSLADRHEASTTHSRERPRLLRRRRGPGDGVMPFPKFQPTAENVLGCCCGPSSPCRRRPRSFNPQPRTSSAAPRGTASAQVGLPWVVSTPAENVLGCCRGISMSLPTWEKQFQPTAENRSLELAARPRTSRPSRRRPVSTHSRERPRLLHDLVAKQHAAIEFQPTAENVLGCCMHTS